MDQEIIVDAIKHNTAQQSRIADALEEILRLVKLDQEKMAKRFPDEDKE
jgi:ABC-type proline/glycine betaine transport system ATPase subunit